MKTYKDYMEEISKDNLIDYYVTQNHSRVETQEYFKLSHSMLDKLLYLYEIYKPKELQHALIAKTKEAKYGSSNYNGHAGFKFIYTEEEELDICRRYLAGENIWDINRQLHTHKAESILKKHNIPLRTKEENNKLKVEKRKKTCQEKYGVDNPAKASETIDKIKDTWQNKSEEEMKEIKDKSWKKYTYKGLSFDSSWELYYYIWAELHEHDIIREPKVLKYEFEGVSHSYIPDFEVDGELVEIKGDHLFEQMQIEGSMDNAKYKCMLENHVKIIKLEEMQPIIEEVTKLFGNNYLEQFLEASKWQEKK